MGFIKKLPHGLVEAFKATLEEVVQANLLIARGRCESSAGGGTDAAAVNNVLSEIGATDKQTLMVFNKMDKAGWRVTLGHLRGSCIRTRWLSLR